MSAGGSDAEPGAARFARGRFIERPRSGASEKMERACGKPTGFLCVHDARKRASAGGNSGPPCDRRVPAPGAHERVVRARVRLAPWTYGVCTR